MQGVSPALNRPKRLVADRPTTTGAAVTLPRSATDVLADHVVWELECIDRMYLKL